MSPGPIQDALLSSREGLGRSWQHLLAEAARLVAAVANPPQDRETASARLTLDLLDLSEAALALRANLAVLRVDQEASREIVNMVRHDPDASAARDTRPDPRRKRSHPHLDRWI